MRDAVEQFRKFNREDALRSHELMRMKINRMAESPFAFFRGSFHLFAADVVAGEIAALPSASEAATELDLVGDIHSENYGTFKAADGAIHYDVNDFDETTSGRITFDVCRFAANSVLAAQAMSLSLESQAEAVLAGLGRYCYVIQSGQKKSKHYDLDYAEKSPGDCSDIANLIRQEADVKRSKFIADVTEDTPEGRRIRRSLTKYFDLPDAEKAQVHRLVADLQNTWKNIELPKRFFDLHDVCGRISGIGSMGRHRFVALVSGKGHAEYRNVLLEFKEARTSALDLARGRAELTCAGRAEKVITCQRQSQAVSSAYLGWARDGEMSFQVREISPHAERVDWKKLKTPAQFFDVLKVQSEILGRIHLRSSRRLQGPVNAWPDLEEVERFRQRMLAFALTYADIAYSDWRRFRAAGAELANVAAWAV